MTSGKKQMPCFLINFKFDNWGKGIITPTHMDWSDIGRLLALYRPENGAISARYQPYADRLMAQ